MNPVSVQRRLVSAGGGVQTLEQACLKTWGGGIVSFRERSRKGGVGEGE